MSDLLLENVSNDTLLNKLRNTIYGLYVYTENNGNVDLGNYSTLLIDFKQMSGNCNQYDLVLLIRSALREGKNLIFLNVENGMELSKIIGIGLTGKCVIVKPYGNYNVINVLGLYSSDIYSECSQNIVTQNAEGNECNNHQDATCCECSELQSTIQGTFGNLCLLNQVRVIESILESEIQTPWPWQQQACPCPLGNTPADLPENQFRLNYLAIEGMWNLTDQQVTNNSVVMEISLIASFNPKYKYLRIRSVGAGFNPANGAPMQSDSTYDRGYFQSKVNIHMQPNSTKLRTLSTEPKNVNNQTQYTTSSEFSVGVDIAKNPSFNSSYTISETMSTVVSDFNVYNNGAGVTADWNFVLSMTENSIWDIFSEPFMKKGQVKKLPALATKNLQTVTESVWYGDNTLCDSIGVQLYWTIDHYRCWVTGDWTSFTEHYSHKWRTVGYKDTPVYIDFSSVNA